MARRRAYLGGRRAAYKGCGSAPPLGPRSAIIRAEAARPRPIVPLPTHQLLAPPRRPPAVSWSRRSHRARRCCPPAPAAAPSRTQGRETARQRTPPDAARGVPAASRPAHGGGSNARCAGKRRPQRRGPPAAAPPPLPPWAAGCVVYPAAVPPHQVLARLRLATTAVRCVHSPHLPAVMCWLLSHPPPMPLWSAKSRHKPFGNKIHP